MRLIIYVLRDLLALSGAFFPNKVYITLLLSYILSFLLRAAEDLVHFHINCKSSGDRLDDAVALEPVYGSYFFSGCPYYNVTVTSYPPG